MLNTDAIENMLKELEAYEQEVSILENFIFLMQQFTAITKEPYCHKKLKMLIEVIDNKKQACKHIQRLLIDEYECLEIEQIKEELMF